MALPINSRLGPYEIKSPLGAGGMGEVYRARDSRLNRDVAIKVLRGDAASTPELKARFEREARAVAALNHPNIVAVYDFGVDSSVANGAQYIVSELIDGESLRRVIGGRPVPVRKLIEIAVQVADGLSAAHAAGIVHRDLKPENVLLTRDGRAKILDFGLARQSTKTVQATSNSDETFFPDPADQLTGAGSVLGTAAYMSPEQALGKETDFRSDQFSLGLILYEMASGKQTFSRGSSVETMAAIVRDDPPPIEEKLPSPLKWIIDRCLAKETDQRYESTRDLYRDLRNLRDHLSEAYSSSASGTVTPIAAPAKLRPAFWWKPLVAALATGAVCALAAYLLKPSGPDLSKYRYSPFAADGTLPVWSPDGKAIAYSAPVDGVDQIFLRYLSSSAPVQLTHEKQPTTPLGWASDRDHILAVTFSDINSNVFPVWKLESVATVGGDPEFLKDVECLSCTLSNDGRVFAIFDGKYTLQISDPPGSPPHTYQPAPKLNGLPDMRFSPDGKKLLLISQKETWILPYPAGGNPLKITREYPQVRQSSIPMTASSASWLPDSRHILITATAERGTPTHLWMTDTQSSKTEQLTAGTDDESFPAVSPDGDRIVYTISHQQFDIVSVAVADGSAKTLISTGQKELAASWARNQAKLTWVTNRSGAQEIWVRSPDGSERPVVTAADFSSPSASFLAPSLSPDGQRLIFAAGDITTGFHLWIASLTGGPPVRLTNDLRSEYGGAWSPDGNRFVYYGNNSKGEIALMTVKTVGNATPIVLKEGKDAVENFFPDWSPSGEWITYCGIVGDKLTWHLISADGKQDRPIGDIDTSFSLVFSKDGRLLYGIEQGMPKDQSPPSLFSIDVATLQKRTIRDLPSEFSPAYEDPMYPRFSLDPDGNRLVYAAEKSHSGLWMLTGYRRPGWADRLRAAFSR